MDTERKKTLGSLQTF